MGGCKPTIIKDGAPQGPGFGVAEEVPALRAREGNRTEAPRRAGDRRPPQWEPQGEKDEGAGSEP